MGSQPSRPRRPRAPRGAPPAARPPPPGRGPCAGPRAVGWRRWPCSAGRRPLASPRRRRAVAGRSPGGRPRSPGSPPAAGRRRLRGGGLPGLRDPRRRARAGRGRADGSRLGRRRGPHRRGRRDHRREGPARRPRRLRLLRPRHRAGREAGRPGGGPLVLDPPAFDPAADGGRSTWSRWWRPRHPDGTYGSRPRYPELQPRCPCTLPADTCCPPTVAAVEALQQAERRVERRGHASEPTSTPTPPSSPSRRWWPTERGRATRGGRPRLGLLATGRARRSWPPLHSGDPN